MVWTPGWNSVSEADGWSNFYFWAGIFALFLLLVFEAASHVYTLRKDDLVAQQQDATQKSYDKEMARLHLETAQANAQAALLKFQLNQEIQKRAPRFLTEDQKAAMLAELKGKIPEIAIVTQNDPEAQAFALQFVGLFQDAGAHPIYVPEPPREDRWFTRVGVAIYSPAGSNEDQLKDDPLYRALKRANLFGGTASKPFLSLQLRGPDPGVISGYNGHVLYIGQKSPF